MSISSKKGKYNPTTEYDSAIQKNKVMIQPGSLPHTLSKGIRHSRIHTLCFHSHNVQIEASL